MGCSASSSSAGKSASRGQQPPLSPLPGAEKPLLSEAQQQPDVLPTTASGAEDPAVVPPSASFASAATAPAPDRSIHPALAAELIDPSPPSLSDRAVAMPFLLATIGKQWPEGRSPDIPSNVSLLPDAPTVPTCADGRELQSLKVWEVAEYFVKPATATGVCSFIQAFHKGTLEPAELRNSLMRTTRVVIDHWRSADIATWRDLTGDEKFVFEYGVRSYDELLPSTGPVTWFVSHTWSRPWLELVDTIWQHYLQVPSVVFAPGHWNGLREIRVLPLYYWIDIFAVSQQVLNQVGAVAKHPDCQFTKVIAASRGTVLTLSPWWAPVTVSRVWCLFEIMRTLQAGRVLALVPERSFWDDEVQISREAILDLVRLCVDSLDVSNAGASFAADKDVILDQIKADFGMDEFNDRLRAPMRSRLLEALTMRALRAKDVVSLEVCADSSADIVRSSLDLQHQGIGLDCGIQLSRILMHNSHVTELSLAGNALGDAGAIAFAKALISMPCIESVDLGSNDIGEQGGQAIAAAIRQAESKAWRVICLDKNHVGDAAALALLASLEGDDRSAFLTVYIKWNGLSADTLAAMYLMWEQLGKKAKGGTLALEIQ